MSVLGISTDIIVRSRKSGSGFSFGLGVDQRLDRHYSGSGGIAVSIEFLVV
jgi:hypothetical protein